MAWLEKRRGTLHLNFRVGPQKFKRSLKTADEREAAAIQSRVERRLRLIEQGDLQVPDGADIVTFLLTDGKRTRQISISKQMSLSDLFDRYEQDANR